MLSLSVVLVLGSVSIVVAVFVAGALVASRIDHKATHEWKGRQIVPEP